MRWFVAGGLAPDVPLYLLTAGSVAWFGLTRGMAPPDTLAHAFGTLFFEHPFWKAANSVLHAPLVLIGLHATGRAIGGARGAQLRAFAGGAAVHAVVDVATHHSDGPLVLFPLDWSYRFASPVSYWEPDHFGRPMSVLDLGLTVGLGLWALRRWRRHGVVIGPLPEAEAAGTRHDPCSEALP